MNTYTKGFQDCAIIKNKEIANLKKELIKEDFGCPVCGMPLKYQNIEYYCEDCEKEFIIKRKIVQEQI